MFWKWALDSPSWHFFSWTERSDFKLCKVHLCNVHMLNFKQCNVQLCNVYLNMSTLPCPDIFLLNWTLLLKLKLKLMFTYKMFFNAIFSYAMFSYVMFTWDCALCSALNFFYSNSTLLWIVHLSNVHLVNVCICYIHFCIVHFALCWFFLLHCSFDLPDNIQCPSASTLHALLYCICPVLLCTLWNPVSNCANFEAVCYVMSTEKCMCVLAQTLCYTFLAPMAQCHSVERYI